MKKNYTRSALALFLMVCNSIFLFAQDSNNYWSKIKTEDVANLEKVHRASHPRTFQVYQLDLERFKQAIQGAPIRGQIAGKSNVIAEFPTPEGTFERFRIAEAPIMEEGLAIKFPMIKSYAAQGIDDPTATMRFTITQFGLHTMTLSGNRSSMFIDPYTEDRATYMVYDKKSLGMDPQGFECFTGEKVKLPSLENEYASTQRATDDSKLRTYRLAQSCTAEYGSIFRAGATVDATIKANIQAQMAVTMARVNGVYERDLAITMVFIANNDQIIYYGTGPTYSNYNSDPWTNEWNTKTAETIDAQIGVANYDIGHNFNTTGGGNAGCLGCVCLSVSQTGTHKGRGYTGRANPTGDPFDIDYVAHEMGHQFDGYHTQSNNSCRSGSGLTEVEPGSGSSIMGYAGICAANVQNNSDAHFNYVNIRDISANVQTGNSSTCDVETNLTNQPPVAIVEGASFNIPKSTPFILRGDSTDPDGTAEHTFGWSQNDPENPNSNSAPASTRTVGPMYRSIMPTSSPDRYMPSIADVVAGNLTPTWEVTPSVARTLNFALVVRDNASGFANGIGQTDDALMVVNVEDVTPFTMSTPNTAVTWNVGSEQTVTWNVGSTTNATINCQNVNIKLSTDGGFTYPITLACNTPNDGTEPVVIPDNVTSNARIMVEAADNIFYDISDTNFTISNPAPTFVLQRSDLCIKQEVCTNASLDIDLDFSTVAGFNQSTTFSASSLPTGVVAGFTPANLSANGTVTMNLSSFGAVAPGDYNITVTGTSASATNSITVPISVYNGSLSVPTLTTPTNGQTGIVLAPTLNWAADANATSYEVEIATDAGFTNIVNNTIVATNSYVVNPTLNQLTQYFWRVRSINSCATGTYSGDFNFTTDTCTLCPSVANTTYATSTTLVNINTINRASAKPSGYSDYTASDITTVNREDQYALNIQVNTDGAYTVQTLVWIDWNHNCVFDVPSEEYDLGTANNVADGATSNSGLMITVPAGAELGHTTMRVTSKYSGDGLPTSCENGHDAEVEDYTLDVQVALSTNEEAFNQFMLFPNPNRGDFTISLTSSSNQNISVLLHDVRGRQIFDKSYENTGSFNQRVNLTSVQSGIYFVTVTDGEKKEVRKIIIE